MSKYPLAFGRVSVHDLVCDGQKQYIIQKKMSLKCLVFLLEVKSFRMTSIKTIHHPHGRVYVVYFQETARQWERKGADRSQRV